MSHPELEFFNALSGRLEIELTEAPKRIGDLENERATPTARIRSITLAAQVYEEAAGILRDPTLDELASTAFDEPQITLAAESGGTVTHDAPNGTSFSVADLLTAVAETERQTRDDSEWFGGVDVHHVYFEGIEEEEPGVWTICWGS